MSRDASTTRLNAYVELLETAMLLSQLRSDPGDWYGLRRMLRAVASNMSNASALKVPDWACELELALWIDCLRTHVLPEVLERLFDEIQGVRYRWGGPEASDRGVWAPIDRRERTQSARLQDEAAAEAALLGAYRQHREKASAARMRGAVQALKDLSEQRIDSTPSYGIAVVSAEGEFLDSALATVFPPTARLLLSTLVSLGFEDAVKGMNVRQLSESRATDWYRRYPGLDRWRPIWAAVDDGARGQPCEGDAPNLFFPETQQTYITLRDRRERDKKGQERT